jgi:two-component system LytT family response regulator
VARVRNRDVLVPVESVEYIAADDIYAAVHSQADVRLIRQSLDFLETRLDPARFVRVHRSFIVQADYVTALRRAAHGGQLLTMRSGAQVPVRRRRRDVIQKALAPRLRGKRLT